MKKHLYLLALAPAMLLPGQQVSAQPTPEAAPVVNRTDEVVAAVQKLTNANDYIGAARAALAAARGEGRSLNDAMRLVRMAADATGKIRVPLTEEAVAPYREAAADAALPNQVRVELLNLLSGFLLDLQAGTDLHLVNTKPAWEALESALALPNLQPGEKAAALTNIAKWWEREGAWDKARAAYTQILEMELPANVKGTAQRAMVQTWVSEGKVDEALRATQEYKLDPIAVYSPQKDRAKYLTEVRKILDDASRPESQRWNAFASLPQFSWASANDPVLAEESLALGRQYFPAFAASDPRRANSFMNRFRNVKFSWGLPGSGHPLPLEFLVWSASYLVQSPTLSANDYDLVRFKAGNALAALGRKDQLLQEAKAIQADTKVSARTRLWAALLLATQDRQANAKPEAAVKNLLGTPGKGEDKVWAAREAARTAGRLRDEASARLLLGAGEGLLNQAPVARIPSRFLDVAPANVSAWRNSPLLKEKRYRGVLDRPYGDNLQFLIETDSAVLGRTAATGQGDTGDKVTDVYAACDERGLFIFIDAHDTRYREVLEGFASGGGLEMYLAAGEGQSYYAMLANFPEGKADASSFLTNYPGENFRIPLEKDGTYFSVSEPTDRGFGLVMFFAWELFADKLPEPGIRWQFEAIRWTRGGGLSFGGSKSVHNRSSFGEIEFEGLDAKALTAIKRRLVTRAVAMYRDALRINGPVGNWNDPEVGDPEFYKARVEPELQRLEPYAARVTANMTEADVNEIFREAVPAWMNLERRVALARTEYLLEKRTR